MSNNPWLTYEELAAHYGKDLTWVEQGVQHQVLIPDIGEDGLPRIQLNVVSNTYAKHDAPPVKRTRVGTKLATINKHELRQLERMDRTVYILYTPGNAAVFSEDREELEELARENTLYMERNHSEPTTPVAMTQREIDIVLKYVPENGTTSLLRRRLLKCKEQ